MAFAICYQPQVTVFLTFFKRYNTLKINSQNNYCLSLLYQLDFPGAKFYKPGVASLSFKTNFLSVFKNNAYAATAKECLSR